jgi:hypothetical protein
MVIAAVEAGQRAGRHPQQHGEDGRAQSDREARSSAVDDAGQKIATEIVGAERKPVLARCQQRRRHDVHRIGLVEQGTENGHRDDAHQQRQAEQRGPVAAKHDPPFREGTFWRGADGALGHWARIRGSTAR